MPITLGILAQSRQAAVAGDFVLLEQRVLTGSEASVTFSGLAAYASTYKHLQIRQTARVTHAASIVGIRMAFNGIGGTSYSTHGLYGNGSNVFSFAAPNQAGLFAGLATGSTATADAFGASVVEILDFGSSSKNKSTRTLYGAATGEIGLHSGAFLNTNALTSLVLSPDAGSFVQHSRFSLYGIRG